MSTLLTLVQHQPHKWNWIPTKQHGDNQHHKITATKPLYNGHIKTRDVPIIGLAISNSLYQNIFSYQLSDWFVHQTLPQIRYKWWAVTSLLIIKFLGCQLVAKEPYHMNTLRLTLTLQQPTVTKC